ncbi:DUF6988 family protein [uncultured Tolumonas sp.]|uniref:DUF6988 family protein n=1 Tax=uncultured Tolumonas sp. TaxID=263765 RepID=UPI00292E69E8|nr:hypothetical protein [uncultured Tolumonas sp.]
MIKLPMNRDEFDVFLNRCLKLQMELVQFTETINPAMHERFEVAFQSGVLAFEHYLAIFELIKSDLIAPGFSLFRPQYESLVRGIWLLHAASDNWIGKLNQTLNEESAKIGDKAPNLSEMLTQLKNESSAPQHIVEQLYEYKDATWKALNSYTHGGMHPLTRIKSGYPYQLMYNSLRNSNAVAALTGQLLAITTGDLQNMTPIRKLHVNYPDCFPIIQTDGSISK